MKELVGRLTALDPAASETLKVIEYFDTLVAGHAGVAALARGAAALSDARVGVELPGRLVCVDPDGSAAACAGVPAGALRREVTDGTVWIERAGRQHANDAMILERLALAVVTVGGRGGVRPGIEVLIDENLDAAERRAAATRLRLGATVRVVVTRPGEPVPAGPGAPVMTEHGAVHVTIADAHADVACGGVGRETAPAEAAAAFLDALTAARLTDASRPVIRVDDLGVLLQLVRGYRPVPGDDVDRLAALDARTLEIADALNDADSLRAAGTRLGLHHSTVQGRHASLVEALGYDPLRPDGRARYRITRLLSRVRT